jgi:phosphoribosylaminoimidazolecarboxamide formyltransferase/IMP cyclohydrolase
VASIINVKRALISVSDKTGLPNLAQGLNRLGVNILSTGGSARAIREADVDVVEVSAHTGFPEIMDGRVKTLHPKIHGGILARHGVDDEVLAEQNIDLIDLVVVNLYPFEKTITKDDVTLTEAVENIDIGGPTLLRAAAKNHKFVTVVCDPGDYSVVLEKLRAHGGIPEELRYRFATKAFRHTADYDHAINTFLLSQQDRSENDLPEVLNLSFRKKQTLRYGENPHQRAAFYAESVPVPGTVSNANQLQGKELSYNNIADTDAALDCVWSFRDAACCIVKHANPCGVAEAGDIAAAYKLAYATDPTSAFGGIIAFNRPLNARVTESIVENQFVEVIAAPSVEDEALTILARKENIRVLAVGASSCEAVQQIEYKRVMAGLLVQDRDIAAQATRQDALKIVTQRAPSTEEFRDLIFAWRVVACVKSNAIVYARDRRTIGVGAGQMSRIYSARIASLKAAEEKLQIRDAVMASDAFFPFRDSIDAAAKDGIRAVVQPGGSMRDDEVIAAADEHGIAMVFTGERHFRH